MPVDDIKWAVEQMKELRKEQDEAKQIIESAERRFMAIDDALHRVMDRLEESGWNCQ